MGVDKRGMDRAAKEPTTLVIFGATGDLAQRKLLPALFHLFSNGYLPEAFSIVGLSRDTFSSEQYRDFVEEVITKRAHHHRVDELADFLTHVEYRSGLFEEMETYLELGRTLSMLDEGIFNTCSNKLFYLAVPPSSYESVFDHLAKSGLTIPCGGDEGWTRVLVEKPFGRDLATAQALDAKLGKLFQEEQIFRIDHYLAKETVQNIISFRFANALFEPVWNTDSVDSVTIRMWETIGVGQRGSFYEDVGALRDVGQNHLLQMLALTAMDDPKILAADAIRSARLDILKKLKPITGAALHDRVVRGQYESYRMEQSVAAASETETFFRVMAHVDTKRWRGVPFILEAGKKLAENKVEIVVRFKEPVSCVCPAEDQHHQNELTIRIQPDEGIILKFWAKKPGLEMDLEPRNLSFFYKESAEDKQLPDAYEKVLYDCIRGDQTLFASTDEVAASWRFITPILETWQDVPLQTYADGSRGPA